MAQVHLGNLAAGARSAMTGGDPMARMLGHYGKTPGEPKGTGTGPQGVKLSSLGGGDVSPDVTPDVAPAHDPGAAVRDATGGMKRHPRLGGLGPGMLGGYGAGSSSNSYTKGMV